MSRYTVAVLSLFILCFAAYSKQNDVDKIKQEKVPVPAKTITNDEIVYSIDFTAASKKSTDPREWLKEEGFKFKSDAGSQKKLDLSFKNDALNLKAKSGIFGLIIKAIDINSATKVKITWGVNKFPKNASYKNGINNESIMLYIYFGTEKLDSGSMFIPNSPYFLGLFPGDNEVIGKPMKGNHFEEGGRFICIAMPKVGETITSEFNLTKGFKESFGKDKQVPDISAIALEVETSKSSDSDSFIKKIEFIK